MIGTNPIPDRTHWPDLQPWKMVGESAEVEREFRKAALWLSTVAVHAVLHSKDQNTQVGAAILTPEWGVISMGYNGFPIGTPDTDEMWLDRDEKYKRVLHAESNAIDAATQSLKGATLVCNLFPCHLCAARIAQNGIKRVYYSADPRMDLEAKLADEILANAKVETRQIKGIATVSLLPLFGKARWDK